MPHATMWENQPRSVVTLTARPCEATQRDTRTPMDANLRGAPPRCTRPRSAPRAGTPAAPRPVRCFDGGPPPAPAGRREHPSSSPPGGRSGRRPVVPGRGRSRPLPGPVLDHLRAPPGELFRRLQQVLAMGALAESEHRGMLGEQEDVGNLVALAALHQGALEIPGGPVTERPEIEPPERRRAGPRLGRPRRSGVERRSGGGERRFGHRFGKRGCGWTLRASDSRVASWSSATTARRSGRWRAGRRCGRRAPRRSGPPPPPSRIRSGLRRCWPCCSQRRETGRP